MESITKTKCPEDERLDFLPNTIGAKFLHYENLVYQFMSKASDDYNGGFWDYYSLSNGGFYMAYNCDDRMRMEWADNGFQGTMSTDAASICVNLMAQNAFAWQVSADRHGPQFDALRDYAVQHAEAQHILRFID